MERFVTDTAIAKWIESVERDLLKDLTPHTTQYGHLLKKVMPEIS